MMHEQDVRRHAQVCGGTPQNGQSQPDPPPALPEGGTLKDAYVAQDGTLMCAIHHTPLEQSQFNGAYCPRPGDGPRGYCTAKYKQNAPT